MSEPFKYEDLSGDVLEVRSVTGYVQLGITLHSGGEASVMIGAEDICDVTAAICRAWAELLPVGGDETEPVQRDGETDDEFAYRLDEWRFGPQDADLDPVED